MAYGIYLNTLSAFLLPMAPKQFLQLDLKVISFLLKSDVSSMQDCRTASFIKLNISGNVILPKENRHINVNLQNLETACNRYIGCTKNVEAFTY
jgi:hypothetical protein